MENENLLKKPSAWLPVLMSIAAVALPLIYVAMFGVVHETDEGVGAHLWQLLMALQIPIVLFFAVKWLPHNPAKGFIVLAIQAIAYVAALFPVWYFQL